MPERDIIYPIIIFGGAIAVAFLSIALGRNYRDTHTGSKPMAWWYWVGLSSYIYPTAIAVKSLRSGNNVEAGLAIAILLLFIIPISIAEWKWKRRWAFLTLTLWSGNPILWVANSIYVKNRWSMIEENHGKERTGLWFGCINAPIILLLALAILIPPYESDIPDETKGWKTEETREKTEEDIYGQRESNHEYSYLPGNHPDCGYSIIRKFADVPVSELQGNALAVLKDAIPEGLPKNVELKKQGSIKTEDTFSVNGNIQTVSKTWSHYKGQIVGEIFAELYTTRDQNNQYALIGITSSEAGREHFRYCVERFRIEFPEKAKELSTPFFAEDASPKEIEQIKTLNEKYQDYVLKNPPLIRKTAAEALKILGEDPGKYKNLGFDTSSGFFIKTPDKNQKVS